MAPSTAASPTSLLWAHQLKREHAYLLKRMQALETQSNAQGARSVSEMERSVARLYEQAQSEILKMKTQIENLQNEQRKAAEERKKALADQKIVMTRMSAVQNSLTEYGKLLPQKGGHPDAARVEVIEQQLERLAQQVQSHGEKMNRLPESVPTLGVPHDEVRSAAKATHRSDDAKADIANPARNPGGSVFPYRRPQGQALESRGGLQSKSGASKTVPSQSMQHLEIEPPQDSSHHENGGTDPGVDDRTLQAPGTKRRRIDQTTVLEVLEPPTSTAIPSMVDSTSASSSKIKPKRSSRVPRGQHATMLHGVVAKDSEDLYAIPRPQKIAVTGSSAPVAKPAVSRPRKAHCTPQWTQEEANARGRETRRVKYQPANPPSPVEQSGTRNGEGVNKAADADIVYLETAPPEPRRRIVQEEDDETFFRYLRGY